MGPGEHRPYDHEYWTRVAVDPTELPLTERDEEDVRADGWPPSAYDDPAGPTVEPQDQ